MKRKTIKLTILIISSVVVIGVILFEINKLQNYRHYMKEHIMKLKCNTSLLNEEEINQIKKIAINKKLYHNGHINTIDIAKIGNKLNICPKNIDAKNLIYVKSTTQS